MSFHVGQKVVCVDDKCRVSLRRCGLFARWRSWVRLDHNLNRGDIYRVTGLQFLTAERGHQIVCLRVAEAWHFKARVIGFPAFQFRPLIERETDISIFQKMLAPKSKELERA